MRLSAVSEDFLIGVLLNLYNSKRARRRIIRKSIGTVEKGVLTQLKSLMLQLKL